MKSLFAKYMYHMLYIVGTDYSPRWKGTIRSIKQ